MLPTLLNSTAAPINALSNSSLSKHGYMPIYKRLFRITWTNGYCDWNGFPLLQFSDLGLSIQRAVELKDSCTITKRFINKYGACIRSFRSKLLQTCARFQDSTDLVLDK